MKLFLSIFGILIVKNFCAGQAGYNFLRPTEGNIGQSLLQTGGTGLSPYTAQTNVPIPIFPQSDVAQQNAQVIGRSQPTARPIFQIRPTIPGVLSNSLTNAYQSGIGDGQNEVGDYSAIPGQPGIDYPVFNEIPRTNFNCDQQQFPGYYSDIETQCQIFHVCSNNRTFDFLCPNGTIFSQETLVCVWWNQFDCATAPSLYQNNALIYDYSQTGQQIGNTGLQSVGIGARPVTPSYGIPTRSLGVSNVYNQKAQTIPFVGNIPDANYPGIIPAAANPLSVASILRPTYSTISPISTTPVSGR